MEENIKEKLALSNNQQILILKEWNSRSENPPSIPELIKLVFPNEPELDARSRQGRIIRNFLGEKGIKVELSKIHPRGLLELTPEQKEYINNNCGTMKSYEMAKVLFNNSQLLQTSTESRSIYAYVQTLDRVIFDKPEEAPAQDYNPPKTMDRICARINKYIRGANLDFKKLSPKQKKQGETLITYLHSYRFAHQMNIFNTENERLLFESSFIKYTYDKTDLSEEDLDQYILLCTEIVSDSNIQKTISLLQDEQNRVLEESGKMSMTLVDAIKVARDDRNACVKKQQSLYESLTEERSKRLKDEIKDKASLLNLVNLWRNEESRREMIKLAEERKAKLKEEIQRLSTMDDLKCRIVGIGENEILNG